MKYKHFSIEEREKIQQMAWDRISVRSMAKILGRSHSSILRELARSSPGRSYQYSPRLANERALAKRKERGRKDRLKNKVIRSYVVNHLKQRWSPEQISGRMKREGVGTISHEAIYQYIYAEIHRDGYGYLKPLREDLRIYLRRRRKRRIPKGARRCQRIFKPKGMSIEQRPQVVNQRKRIGDWEGDTVESCDHKPGVNTLLERKTGMYLVSRVRNKTSASTVEVVGKRAKYFPFHTLTLDNGPENSDWQNMQKETGAAIFFAHPYSSYERGANENANGLLRDYFPKKTDFSKISDEEIAEVEYALNTRPRKRLGYLTPLEAMSGAVRG